MEAREGAVTSLFVAQEEVEQKWNLTHDVSHFATLTRKTTTAPHQVDVPSNMIEACDNLLFSRQHSRLKTHLKEQTQDQKQGRDGMLIMDSNVASPGNEGLKVPPSSDVFAKPPALPRKLPTRWESVKKAFEEKPLVLKVMEPKDFSLLQHYTETPV